MFLQVRLTLALSVLTFSYEVFTGHVFWDLAELVTRYL